MHSFGRGSGTKAHRRAPAVPATFCPVSFVSIFVARVASDSQLPANSPVSATNNGFETFEACSMRRASPFHWSPGSGTPSAP